jgi:hypothetical protein
MARRADLAHIPAMASRTCKPDADFKRLWRTLFPGTPFPSCGTAETAGEDSAVTAAPSQDQADSHAEPTGMADARVR